MLNPVKAEPWVFEAEVFIEPSDRLFLIWISVAKSSIWGQFIIVPKWSLVSKPQSRESNMINLVLQ